MTFSYDGNGNLISGTDGRTNSYTVFNKPYAMSRAGSTVTIDYGPNRERYRRLDNVSGQVTVTHYVGSIEKITRPGPVIEIKRYLDGEAIETITGSTRTTEYLFTDHLGSVDVITNASGSVVQSMAFDAFGRRRDAVDYDAFTDPMIVGFDSTKTTRGFTFHEQLDPVGLIHMNGRVYDPTLGRFLSPDPFVQDPSNTQSLNRYSYVFNNPLSATDPSGYMSFKDGLKITAAIAASIYTGYAVSHLVWGAIEAGAGMCFASMPFAAGVAGGAAGGLVLGGISSGSVQGAVQGAFSGAVFGVIGGIPMSGTMRVVAHGVAGGGISVMNGGRFGHFFLSAGLTQSLSGAIDGIDNFGPTWGSMGNRVARVIAAATVGGTTSSITGGNFANGAYASAFGRAFNEELHSGGGESEYSTSGAGPVRRGQAATQFARAAMQDLGYEYVGIEMYAAIDGFPVRRYDLVMWSPDRVLTGIEVKSSVVGVFRLEGQQIEFDTAVYTRGGARVISEAARGLRIEQVTYFGVGTSSYLNAAYKSFVLWQRLERAGIQTRIDTSFAFPKES